MNESMDILTAVLVALLVGIMTFVFTGNLDATVVAGAFSLTVGFVATKTFKEDN